MGVGMHRPVPVRLWVILHISSSSPFHTRWGQRPEFLLSRMFYPGHHPG